MRTATSRADQEALWREGYRWQLWLAERLRELDFEVEVEPLWISPDSSLDHLYVDKFDVSVVAKSSGATRHLACKARRTQFTCAADYPHDRVLVDSTWACDRVFSSATVVISQYTKAIFVIPESSRSGWRTSIFPTPHGPKDCYYCRREDCRTLDQLCDWLART